MRSTIARKIAAAALPLAAVTLVAGCGDFETPSIVLDLRVLGIVVEPPEIVVPVDVIDESGSPGSVQLDDVEVCALVADTTESRELWYAMAACVPTRTLRCDDPERVVIDLGEGVVADPEEAGEPVRICATLRSTEAVLAVLLDELEERGSEEAVLAWLIGEGGNLDIQVEMRLRGAGEPEDRTSYASKRMRYALPLPPERVANQNPYLDDLHVFLTDSDEPVSMPAGRCGDMEPLTVAPGAVLRFEPVESEAVREDYLVPTFDGGSRMFTENLTYAWYATHGDWQRENTGGPRDFVGNEPPLDSEWQAPGDANVVGDGLDVPIWVVQRDERGGLSWRETCVRVVPDAAMASPSSSSPAPLSSSPPISSIPR